MSGKKIKPEEKKGTAAAARSSDDDSYENHGRGLNVVLTPVQAPKLRSTEKNEVFNFLKNMTNTSKYYTTGDWRESESYQSN